jgi:hypothetical protein
MAISVSFACNDERGNPVGKFNALDVSAGAIDMRIQGPLDESDGVDIAFEFPVLNGYGKVKIADITIEGYSYTNWYGNWCWDMVRMNWSDMLKIVNHLAKLPDWHMEEGPCDLFDAFNDRHEITPLEWKAEL